MSTILDSLRSISSYPVPTNTLMRIILRRGMVASEEATPSTFTLMKYRLAEADLYKWLSQAPNVSEGGVSFSFTAVEKEAFIDEADSIYSEYGETTNTPYGYIGEDL